MKYILLFFCFSLASSLLAKSSDKFDEIVVIWHGGNPNLWSETIVASFCAKLSSALLTDQGIWGLGVFKRYGCYYDGRLIAGHEVKSPWLLLLEPSSDDLTLTLYQQHQGPLSGGPRGKTLYEYSLPHPYNLISFVQKREDAELLAAPLLFSLPAIARLSLAELASGQKPLKEAPFFDQHPAIVPPELVEIHHFAELPDPRSSSPTPTYGRGALVKDSAGDWFWKLYDLPRKFPADSLFLSAAAAYEVRAQLADRALRRYQVFIQQGTLGFKPRTKPQVPAEIMVPLNVGLRYGRDIYGSDRQFSKAVSFWGLLVESRTGWSQGLRAYYEFSPKVSNRDNGDTFTSQRGQLGRSFTFAVPWFFDQIEITPKLGLWNLKIEVSVKDPHPPHKTQVLPLKISQALAIGLEAGGQWSWQRALLRLWGGYDLALEQIKNQGGGSVSGRRLGIDALFRWFELGAPHSGRWVAPMAFALTENLVISANRDQEIDTATQRFGFEKIQATLVMTYLGVGLSVVL